MIKRIYSIFGVIAAFAILFISCEQPKEDDPYADAIYYEGFEDGIGLWGPNPNADDNTTVSIDTTIGANGTSSSLYLDNTSGSGDYANGAVYITFPEGITPSYISYYVRYKENQDTTGADYAMAVIFYGTTDTSNAESLLYSRFYTDETENYLYVGSGSFEPITIPETWYHIEYKNIIYSNGDSFGTYDLFFNGIELETGVEMNTEIPSNSFSIKAVTLGNDASGSDEAQESWFDELVIE